MKKLPLFLSCLAILGFIFSAAGQDTNNAGTNATPDLQTVAQSIQKKIDARDFDKADYANDLGQLDALIAAAKSTPDPDAAAHMLYMKAVLYLQIFGDTQEATNLFTEVKNDYGSTQFGLGATQTLALLTAQLAETSERSNLKVGETFPDFAVTNLDGKPISVGALKGKVVLLDFWATWCLPCMIQLPNVIATYKKHHDEGLEVIGITLDDDRKALDECLNKEKKKGMTWPQYFDGLGPNNKLAIKYDVASIPFTALIDRNGKVIGKDLRGAALEKAVTDALAQK